jgi:hypothetical protein
LDDVLTKVLAACITLIEQKINLLREDVSGSIIQVNQRIDSIGNLTLSESERKELSESILDAVPLKSLPKELVFISELTDLKKELLTRIDKNDSTVRSYIEQNFEVIGRAIVSIRDQFHAHHHDDKYSLLGHDHDNLATKESLDGLAKNFDDHHHDDKYVGLDEHKTSIDQIHSKFETSGNQILGVVSEIKGEVDTKATKASLASLKSATKASLKSLEATIGDLSKNVDNHKETVEKRLQDHSDALDTLSNHSHDSYAGIDHAHEDVASKEFVETIHNDLKQFNLDLADLNKFVTDQIDDIVEQISSKQDSGEFVTKDELDSHKKTIIDAAIKSIPVPENGKDALGWDFKGHPTKKGVLLHKRDDWKEYKEIILFDEKWISNITKKFGDALQQQREMEQPRFGMASGAVAPGAIAALDDVDMTGIQDGYSLVFNASVNKFVAIPPSTIPPTDEEMPYSKRVDFITDNELYKGEAAVGSSEADPLWRIRKLTIGLDSDVTEVWADGNANYDNVWADRLTYTYT